MLDESNDLVVTSLPNRIFPSTTTHENSKEEEETQPLNQGSTLLLFLLAGLLFCACVLASTLAFVSSFRNERTSEEQKKKQTLSFLSKCIFSFFFLGKNSAHTEEKESDN